MAWRLEVRTARGWTVLAEERGTVGERMPTRAQVGRAWRKAYPVIQTREYRITRFAAPKVRTLFRWLVEP